MPEVNPNLAAPHSADGQGRAACGAIQRFTLERCDVGRRDWAENVGALPSPSFKVAFREGSS